jgi:hypothetical protein
VLQGTRCHILYTMHKVLTETGFTDIKFTGAGRTHGFGRAWSCERGSLSRTDDEALSGDWDGVSRSSPVANE